MSRHGLNRDITVDVGYTQSQQAIMLLVWLSIIFGFRKECLIWNSQIATEMVTSLT